MMAKHINLVIHKKVYALLIMKLSRRKLWNGAGDWSEIQENHWKNGSVWQFGPSDLTLLAVSTLDGVSATEANLIRKDSDWSFHTAITPVFTKPFHSTPISLIEAEIESRSICPSGYSACVTKEVFCCCGVHSNSYISHQSHTESLVSYWVATPNVRLDKN